jgi:hypothetical protein
MIAVIRDQNYKRINAEREAARRKRAAELEAKHREQEASRTAKAATTAAARRKAEQEQEAAKEAARQRRQKRANKIVPKARPKSSSTFPLSSRSPASRYQRFCYAPRLGHRNGLMRR